MASAIMKWFLSFLVFASAAADQGGGGGGGGGEAQELWCIAKNNAADEALQSSLDWACGPGGANCGPIQNGGPCYDPSDLQRTASFAFNDYFLKHGFTEESCSFSNTAALTALDPSHNNCKFPSSNDNGNFTGPVMSGPAGSDLISSDSTSHRWAQKLVVLLLLCAINQAILLI